MAAPYGSWKSPITADVIVSETSRFGGLALDGGDVYWVESRPAEAGRYIIVRRSPDGRTVDMTPVPFNARTRVHEYGGGAFAVSDGTIYFSNFTDQRLYCQKPGGTPHPITPDAPLRYADGIIDRCRNRLICVCEDHTDLKHEAANSLVAVQLSDTPDVKELVSGGDFYASPRLSPDGSQLTWLTWNHPNMPWDGCELWVGEVRENGCIGQTVKVAGGHDESIFQPEWSPDGVLYFVSDRTGWWNLYRWRDGGIEPLCRMEAEFGRAQWLFGMSTYAFESANRIICTYNERGIWHLGNIDTTSGKFERIETPYSEISFLRCGSGYAVFYAGSPTTPESIVRLNLATRRTEVMRYSSNVVIDSGYLSVPQAIEFPTENGLTAYAFFYAPQNRDYTPRSSERPPLIVVSHGGPTGAASTASDLKIQYLTSRGIAVLDVNYGGSTGYGRAYRQRLNGQWGTVDVDDCVYGVRYLAAQGAVDEDRTAIRGGSAGGYTTLCALTFRDIFKAGASYYGVSDLEALVHDTHKFESRYLDNLIGPYPEQRNRYREKSPIHFTDRLSCPLIFLHGLEDKVVPPNQAELMVEALRAKGMPVAYLPFEGEQHGFRRAENIKRALEAELYFYANVFGFALADTVEPLLIENL